MAKNSIFDPTKDGVKADNSGYSSNQIDKMIGESAAALIDDDAAGDDTVYSSAKIYSLLPEDTATGNIIFFDDAIPDLPLKSFEADDSTDIFIYHTDYVQGYLSNNNGDISAASAYNSEVTTMYIPLEGVNSINIDVEIYGSPDNLWIGSLCYDESKTPTGTRKSSTIPDTNTSGSVTISVPSDTKYIRVSTRGFNRLKNIKVYIGDTVFYDLQPIAEVPIPVESWPSIKTFSGNNMFWTNTGGLSITYKKLTTLS